MIIDSSCLLAGHELRSRDSGTLEATVHWSYGLLATRRAGCLSLSGLLRWLDARSRRASVCRARIRRQYILNLLSRLVDKSLVIVEGDGEGGHATGCWSNSGSTGASLGEVGRAARQCSVMRTWTTFSRSRSRASRKSSAPIRCLGSKRLDVDIDKPLGAPSTGLCRPGSSWRCTDPGNVAVVVLGQTGDFEEGRHRLERALARRPEAHADALVARALIGLLHLTGALRWSGSRVHAGGSSLAARVQPATCGPSVRASAMRPSPPQSAVISPMPDSRREACDAASRSPSALRSACFRVPRAEMLVTPVRCRLGRVDDGGCVVRGGDRPLAQAR